MINTHIKPVGPEISKVRRISSYAVILNGPAGAENILLSKLNHGPAQGFWNLVGGGIQHGEHPLNGVVREIKEESGLIVDPSQVQLLTVLSEHVTHQLRGNKHGKDGDLEDFHLIGVIYIVRLDGKPKCKVDGDGDSSDGCRWFSVAEIRRQKAGGPSTVRDEKFVTFIEQALTLV